MRRIACVDADTGEYASQVLHILLGVARTHPQGVQLHELARVILVDVPRRVLAVVQVLQHRRMLQSGHHQIAKMTEDMRPDGSLFIVTHQPA
jgi:hypothetical protein